MAVGVVAVSIAFGTDRCGKTGSATAGKDGVGKFEDRFNEQLGQLSEEASKSGAQASRKAAGIADLVLNSLRDAGEAALSRMNKYKKD